MSINGQIRYFEVMRIDPLHYYGDPRLDAYMFVLVFHERLYWLSLADSNKVTSLSSSSLG